jgi:hypothetical protein
MPSLPDNSRFIVYSFISFTQPPRLALPEHP